MVKSHMSKEASKGAVVLGGAQPSPVTLGKKKERQQIKRGGVCDKPRKETPRRTREQRKTFGLDKGRGKTTDYVLSKKGSSDLITVSRETTVTCNKGNGVAMPPCRPDIIMAGGKISAKNRTDYEGVASLSWKGETRITSHRRGNAACGLEGLGKSIRAVSSRQGGIC